MTEDAALQLQLKTSRESVDGLEVVILACEGDLDLRVVEDFRGALASDELGEGDAVILDLSALRFIDSAGIHALVRGWQDLVAGSRPARIVIERGSNLERVLDISGLLERLDPAPARAAAVESMREGATT
jgi:anti-anti-sigma factor